MNFIKIQKNRMNFNEIHFFIFRFLTHHHSSIRRLGGWDLQGRRPRRRVRRGSSPGASLVPRGRWGPVLFMYGNYYWTTYFLKQYISKYEYIIFQGPHSPARGPCRSHSPPSPSRAPPCRAPRGSRWRRGRRSPCGSARRRRTSRRGAGRCRSSR